MDDVSIGPLTAWYWIVIAVKQWQQMLCRFSRHTVRIGRLGPWTMYPSGPLISVDCHCCEAALNNFSRQTHWTIRYVHEWLWIRPLIGVDCHWCEAALNIGYSSFSCHKHWAVRSMNDVFIGPLTVWIFYCCEAVFQTNVVPLFPPFTLAFEVHGRCMDDLLRQASKSKSFCKPSTLPSSVHQSKFWKFLRPKCTRYYAYIIKENLRYYAQVLVLIAKKHALFPKSTCTYLDFSIDQVLSNFLYYN